MSKDKNFSLIYKTKLNLKFLVTFFFYYDRLTPVRAGFLVDSFSSRFFLVDSFSSRFFLVDSVSSRFFLVDAS